MDRTRGLFVVGNKKANRMGWLFCKVNLGGLGRNRTTDTRIFNSFVGQTNRLAGRCSRVLLCTYDLRLSVTDKTLIRLACALSRLFSRASGRQCMSRSQRLMKRNFTRRPAKDRPVARMEKCARRYLCDRNFSSTAHPVNLNLEKTSKSPAKKNAPYPYRTEGAMKPSRTYGKVRRVAA